MPRRRTAIAVTTMLMSLAAACVPQSALHFRVKSVMMIGELGTGDGNLHDPRDVAIGPRGDIYVLDYNNQRVVQYTSKGGFVRNYPADHEVALPFPNGICLDREEYLYVTEAQTNRILRFAPTGELASVIPGPSQEPLMNPVGIVIGSNDVIYVVNHLPMGLIKMFQKDGHYLGAFGGPGSGAGVLHHPYDITSDKDNNLYVSDIDARRIVVFGPNGQFLNAINVPYKNAPEAFRPYGVAVTYNGLLYTSDTPGNVIWVINAASGKAVSYFGDEGTYEGQFYAPAGIAVDRHGDLFVSDIYNHRIQKFKPIDPIHLHIPTFWQWITQYSLYAAVIFGALSLGFGIWLILRAWSYRPLIFIDRVLLGEPRAPWRAALYALGALGFAGAAQYLIWGRVEAGWQIGVCYGLAALLFIKASRGALNPHAVRLVHLGAEQGKSPYRLWLLRMTLTIAALGLAGWSAWLQRDYYLTDRYHGLSYILWLACLPLWWLAWDPWRMATPERRQSRYRALKIIVLAVVIAAAVFLRLYRITELPAGVDNDEAIHGYTAIDLMKNHQPVVYSPEAYGVETLHFYLMGLLFKVIKPNYVAMRITSGITAIVSIILMAVYLNRQFGYKAALMGAGFMGFSMWHLVYSRVALRVIAGAPWTILTFHFLLRHGKSTRRDMLLAGLSMGIGQFTYSPLRSLPGMAALVFFLALFSRRFRYLFHGLLMFATTVLTALPMIMYAIYRYGVWAGRTRAILSRGVEPHTLLETAIRTWDTLLQFYKLLPRNYTVLSFSDAVNSSMQTSALMLGLIIPVFFTFGLIFFLIRAHRPLYLVNLAWFVAALAPSVLFGPNASREIIVMPVVFTFIGVAAAALWNGVTRRIKSLPLQALVALGAVAALGAAGGEVYRTYFLRYAVNHSVRSYFCEVATAMGKTAQELTPRGQVVIVQNTCFDTTKFMISGIENRAVQVLIHPLSRDSVLTDVETWLRMPRRVGQRLFFIIELNELCEPIKELIAKLYPETEFEKHFGQFDANRLEYEVATIPETAPVGS